MSGFQGHILALSGGVGGAKLAAGLNAILPEDALTVAVNTGDDFAHLGLHISPDIDSVIYAMAGLNDRTRGWGVADETWHMMDMLGRLNGPQWFNLGDRDLAMHLLRTEALSNGKTLAEVTRGITQGLGITGHVVPMTNEMVRTQVQTEQGWLDFQEYFVGQQCEPSVSAIRFMGAERAQMAEELQNALTRDDLAGIVICPSNPFLSVDPFLAVPGFRAALAARKVPCIAISPLIGGKAVKGPLGKLLEELGLSCDNAAIAQHYRGLIDHLIIDESDAADAEGLSDGSLSVTVRATLMKTNLNQEELARDTIALLGLGV